MDVILELADDYVFDRAYSYFLPDPSSAFDGSSFYSGNSSFSSGYAYPHPPSPSPSSSVSASSSLTSIPPVYASSWGRDNMYRQAMSLFWIAWIGSFIMYFAFASLSYYFIFDHRLKYHPKFLKNQIWKEVKMSLIAMPTIDVMTLPWFVGEVRGHSLLYDKVGDYGWAWLGISTVLYLVFNDVMIYWIHRIEHHKSIYKYVHKRESIFNSATVGVAWMGVEWRGPSDYLTRGR
jgi:lathosterol oxidase